MGTTDAGRAWMVPAALAALCLLGLFALDQFFAHGLSATYWITHNERREQLVSMVEHRVGFPNEHRPLARIVQHWDFKRFPQFSELPELDLELRGSLRVPAGETRIPSIDSPASHALKIDGQTPTRPLSAGLHQIDISVRQELGAKSHVSLALMWQGPKDATPIASSAFTPKGGAWTPARIANWALGLPCLLALGWLAFGLRARRAALSTRSVHGVLTVALLVVGLGLRAFDYDVMPDYRENGDELFATWNGYSLLTEGETRGWSLWSHRYGSLVKKAERVRWLGSSEFVVIQPYFEHPPLLHLMVGAAAKLGGAEHWKHTQHRFTRLVPVALSTLTILLLIAIATRLMPAGPGPYLAGLLYAVLPVIVIQGRAVKEEALLTPLSLLGTWLYLRFCDSERRRTLVLAAVCMALCTWTKITGFVFVPVLVMWLTARERYRDAAIACAVGVALSSLILVYGAVLGWDNFWFATVYQAASRPKHFNLLPRFFDDGLINGNLVGRGWLLFLWLAFALWIARQAEHTQRIVLLPLLVYLFAIAVPSGNWTFGWYAMPLYPWLCLGAGGLLAEALKQPSLLHGTLIVGFALMYGLNFTITPTWAKQRDHWVLLRQLVSAFVVVSMAPYALREAFPRVRAVLWAARITTWIALVSFVGLSGYFVVQYDVLRESHANFDRDKFFDR